MKSDHLNQYRPWQGRQNQEVSSPACHAPFIVPFVLDFPTRMNRLKSQMVSHLEEGNHPKRGLHRLHLRVLCQQHVLNPRLTVVQRAVPRHVVPATEGVLCGETAGTSALDPALESALISEAQAGRLQGLEQPDTPQGGSPAS